MSPDRKAVEAEWAVEMRAREAENRRLAGIAWLGGPDAFANLTFEKFNPDLNGTHRLLSTVKKFDTRKKNLLMLGPWGSGKTHLAAAKAHEIFDMGGRVRYFTKKSFSDFTRREGRDWLLEIRELDLWILDDLENKPNTDTLLTAIQIGIDERRNYGKAGMIGITNKDMTGLGDVLGGKLQDRFNGYFQHLVIPAETPSARGLLKEAQKKVVDTE